ncbi:MAG: 2-amino-4-hydroxy-6-hydroxymethyldihydropteridine diphosphokinase [Candidatus Omnitrophica bacterium]|nr:2-amino-4-hydroxy-6-hydroxymethyldihydropteridine diphosphokinase [Candidatus Omnitrophota bacterium]
MRCYIGIGSNLGDRQGNIDSAVQKLRKATGIEVKKISRIYETESVGGPPQPKYLNGVIEIETEFAPRQILDILQDIENRIGRIRTVRNAPRVIDLDILTCANLKIDEPDLKIPHPRMAERDFVKEPLKDLMQ